MSLVSVVIPNYNHARFLKRRLETVLNQSFQDFEIIILDDASTDDSREMLEVYRTHPKVKAICYNDNNTGSPMAQWLKGIALAESDWIWMAESDDYCELNFLENLLPALHDEKVCLAFNEVCFVDENDAILHAPKNYQSRYWSGHEFLVNNLIEAPTICNASMALFRKSALRFDVELMDQYAYSPDYLFWCELVMQGTVYSSGKPISYFVKHPQEFTGAKVGTLQDIRDHTLLLDHLLTMNYIGTLEVKRVIKSKLVFYSCIKKGISSQDYESLTAPWLSLAAKWHVRQKPFQIMLASLYRKLKHKKRSILNA